MKRAAALLLACNAVGGTAYAQSSVVIYGKLSQGVAKAVGTSQRTVQENLPNDSRLGFRGTEDLGDGYAAFFTLEHRFRPDDGNSAVATRFWQGMSVVGMKTPLGSLTLGRQYTPSFSLVENQVDPFQAATVAIMRDLAMRPGASVNGLSGSPAGTSAASKLRESDAIRYDVTVGGFGFAASVAESNQEAGTAPGPNRPWSAAASYTVGDFYAAVGFENPQGANDQQWTFAARYRLGPALMTVGYADAKTATNLPAKGAMVGLTYSLKSGDLRAAYGMSKVGTGATARELGRLGLGYVYNFSKRTRIYTTYAYERKIQANRSGYDLGIEHFF